VVAVANSSCPVSSARLYSAHSSMSCLLLSCAISAIRRPAGAGRSMGMKILSVVSRPAAQTGRARRYFTGNAVRRPARRAGAPSG
jgi:hypothetical protein